MESPPLLLDGPDDAPLTIVLAHGAGAPMDSTFMAAFAEELAAEGYRAARFEFPYMAERRRTDTKKPPDRAHVLLDTWRAVIGELGGDGLVIGGKSMGGRIAQAIASRYPDRVAALVLAATAAKPNALNLYSLKLGAYLYKNYGPSAAASVGPLVDFTHSYFAKALPVLVDKLGAVPENPMPLHAFMGHVGAIEDHDTSGVLGSIRSPTLVVIGDQEWLNPLPDANALVEGIPDARLQVITGASHGLIVEQPEQFNQCVLDFFCEYHRLADGLSLS